MATVGDDIGSNSEEGELVEEGREADVARHVDSPGPVVVEDVAEQFGIAVEKVLAGVDVAKVFAFVRAEQRVWKAQAACLENANGVSGKRKQRVWKALDRLQPGVVVSTAHVHLLPFLRGQRRRTP